MTPPPDEREICARLAPAVRAFARRRLHGAAAVEDFTHDVMVTFLVALREGRIEDPQRAAGFCLGICRNFARDRARARDRHRDALDRYADPEADVGLPWEPVLLDRAHLEDCLSTLTTRARSVLRKTFYEDRSDDEIARELDTSAGNVRVIRHRCIASLHDCLQRPLSWEQG